MPDSSGAAIQVYGAGDGSPYGLAALRNEVENLRQAPPGTRNDQLNRSAFSLAQLVASGHLKRDVVLFALINACIGNGLVKDDGFDAVQSTIESGLRAGLVTPRDTIPDASADGDGRKLTEDELALLFASRHENELLYDHTRGTWFLWNGSCWEEDRNKPGSDGFSRPDPRRDRRQGNPE